MKFTKWLRYLVENADSDWIEPLTNNPEIIKKELSQGGLTIWALNFTRDVFTKSLWDSQTVKARGLFVSVSNGTKSVLARAYDKFFNLGEIVGGNKEKQTIDSLVKGYPVIAWHKYNGYLGIMSGAPNTLQIEDIVYTGVFFDSDDFKSLLQNIKNNYGIEVDINRDPLHVTLWYYNNDNIKRNKINELQKIQNKSNIHYTPTELYIAEEGNKKLITLKVAGPSNLQGQSTAHITLYANGWQPVESSKLIDTFNSWEPKAKKEKYKINENYKLSGILGHYLKGGEVQSIFDNNTLFIASKSTNEGTFKKMFQTILLNTYRSHPKKLVALKKYLINNKCSMVFEVIEPEEDAHIIKYSSAKIVLLDIIKNQEQFKRVDYKQLKKLSKDFNLNCKEEGEKLKDKIELQEFISKINQPHWLPNKKNKSEENEPEPIEGFVFEDKYGNMFKFKSNYYNYWKKMRSVTDAMVKALYDTSAPTKTSKIQDVFINMTSGIVQSYFGAIDKIPETNSKEILAKKEILEKKKSDAVKSLCGFIEKIPVHMIDSNLKKNIITEIQNFINKLFAKKRDKLQIEEIANTFENINIFLKQREPDDKIKNAGNVALEKMKNLIMKANPELFNKSKDNKSKDEPSEPDMEQEKAFIEFLAKNPHLLEKVKIGDKFKSPSIVQLRDAYEKEKKAPIKIKYNLYKVEDNAGDEDGDDGGDKKNEDTNLEDLWENLINEISNLTLPSNVHIIINRNEDAKLIKDLNLKTKTLIIASGVMGSGKSTWIKDNLKKLSKDDLKKLSKDDLKKYVVRSTDDEFTDKITGEYKWSRGGLKNAHKNNLEKAKTNIDSGQNVVIDNTNLDPSEFEKYIAYAKSKGYEIIFLIFATDPKKILGDEGVNSPERKNIGKDFSKPEDLKKVYDKINSFYNGGIQQIIKKAEKFK